MKIIITEAVHEDKGEVSKFLTSSNVSLAYHHIQWLEAVKEAYGHDYHYLIAKETGKIVGVLPICIFKGLLGKKSYCSLPFCDIGGVVSEKEQVREALINNALGMIEGDNCHQLEIRQHSMKPATDTDFTNQKVSMLLELPDSSEKLMKAFRSKLRSQVKRAEKNGLTFDYASDKRGIEDFFFIFSRNMHCLGSPVHSIKLFEALQEAYQENLLVGRVAYDNKVVGAGILMFSGKNVSIPWASTLKEYNRLAPNMWLYWNLLRISCERGCKTFDFGRSTYQESTFNFKEQWGAKPALLDWQYLDKSGQAVVYSPSKSGKLRQFVETLWKRSPLTMVNFLGPHLRKHISL